MPELPDLEIIREVLSPALAGQTITGVEVVRPLIVRDLTGRGFTESVVGRAFAEAWRRGKLLVFPLPPERVLLVDCKLAGRLQYGAKRERRLAKTHVELALSGGSVLRYSDRRTMGQIYITDRLTRVPGWCELGPEPLDLSVEAFADRLREYRGEIKGTLTRQRVVAGIGNAYADEICFAARLHPYRRRASLTPEEIVRLHEAMQTVLRGAIETLRTRVGSDIHREIRDFLCVHGRGSEPCPVCGGRISEIRAHGRLTNFCRSCQPGGLIRT